MATALALCLLAVGTRGEAHAEPVDLELVLAVDVSRSVDNQEAKMQRNGYLLALLHPAVLSAIGSGPLGRIAVLYVEWAGQTHQRKVVDWRVIDGLATARAFVGRLEPQTISRAPYTSISAVIDFARAEIAGNGFEAPRATIDISGDGPNSDGRRVKAARDDAVAAGITINGLPILSTRPSEDGIAPAIGVASYYERNVIGGRGAFAYEVEEYRNFAPILVDKLVREIRGQIEVSGLVRDRLRPAPPPGHPSGYCRGWPGGGAGRRCHLIR